MDILLNLGLFIVSLAVLLKAADYFIDSAEEIGLSFGISPFIIGVTIVAFGTSLPELATSIASIFKGESSIVVGNVVGSNITNIALVLGIAVVWVGTLKVPKNIWNIDLPFLLASAFFLWFVLQDQKFSFLEALLFLAGMIIFLVYSLRSDVDSGDEQFRGKPSLKTYLTLVVAGVFVWLSADFTITAISALSLHMGISPDVIALSMVALGTSLPEVIVSLKAARKGKSSIAIGNVLGSNIFNTYAVMAIPSFFGELVIPDSVVSFSLPFMIMMTILFAVMSVSRNITRWEGLVLLMLYTFYIVELFKSTG
jgi:cation:H+ antiporter